MRIEHMGKRPKGERNRLVRVFSTHSYDGEVREIVVMRHYTKERYAPSPASQNSPGYSAPVIRSDPGC